MQIFKFLWNYKIGVTGGIIYAIFSALAMYSLACTTSEGLCIIVAPSVFHQTVIESLTGAPTNPWFISLVNLIVFVLEGAGIEFLVRKIGK